jgi:hypothetical protein
MIIEPQLDSAEKFTDGLAMVQIGEDRNNPKYGYIDKTGKYVWTPSN